ncbi:ABC transporter substrate-binding protein [Ruminiclostridium cellobioparum]|jgi:putative aldouronate transport system substrate-binding protein|uniref:ABC transporter substrate-binding protein n=1 Tax=Ruminiclostridium cellobioparum TaxID=29355 RepID=UPI0028A6327F|nr:ABC transporter substrate-binding protein [Ruminiclostridium cellobioparum]
MQKAKRLTGLFLVLCLAITFVVGCGSGDNGAATSTTSAASSSVAAESSAAAESSVALDPVELKWYVVGNGQPKDIDAVMAKVNEWLKPRINATLKLTIFTWGDDFEQKMGAKIASGEEYDITFTSNWAANYLQNAPKGAFVDLTPLLDKYAPKTKELLGDKVIKGASIDGKLYAIPTNKEMAHNWGFLVNKKLADKNGIDLSTIKKFEDIEPALKIIKEKEPGVEPFQTVVGESAYRILDFEKMVDDNVPGAIYGDGRDTKVINDFDAPETKALFTTLHNWYKAGYIRKDADTITDWQANRKAGKVFSAVASLKPGKDGEESVSSGIEWQQIDITAPMSTTREMTGAMQAISKSSHNPERALMFLELANTEPELCNLINYGIEGTHYTKVSDTKIEQTQAGIDGYNTGTAWLFANQFNTYIFNSEKFESATAKWDQFKAYNDSAKASPILGFTFNAEPVKTKVAALTGVKKQFMPGLETGKSDPAVVLPKFNEKLKAAGLDDVLAEMQKQVDAFTASK